MQVDTEKIDDAVLALLCLTLDTNHRAWKTFDWDALQRLHRKGYIADPVNRAKSVLLSETGVARANALFEAMFTGHGATGQP